MNMSHGGIGEVVNTPDCGSGMRGFDPHISPHEENNSHIKCEFFYCLKKQLIKIFIIFILVLYLI